MKHNIRIQDDLFEFVNGDELSKKEIPSDLPTIGGFTDLVLDVEKTLMNEFDELSKNINSINDIHLKNSLVIYNKILNNTINPETAIKYLNSKLEKINSINDLSSLNDSLLDLYNSNIPLPFRFGVDVDMKATNNHCIYFLGPKMILPDVTYYENKDKKEKLLSIWSEMVRKILSFIDSINKQDIEIMINNAIKFDEILSKIVKSQVEWADYIKNYNPYSITEFNDAIEDININKLFKDVYKNEIKTVIVYDPKFLNGFKTFVNKDTIDLYKSWAYINLILNNSPYLCEELRIISTSFSRFLMGVNEPSKIKKFAYRTICFELIPEPIGIYYGEKYLGSKAKNDVISIVQGLIESYKIRLAKNDWLSKETKEKAILKLDTMNLKIGYPDKLSDLYMNMSLDLNQSVYEIADNIFNYKKSYMNSLLFKPVDKSIWAMPGHLVNACYNPTSNDITFPAAILQKPFYSINQSRAENFGGIGVVIGHEISHAFDNNGAQCDEHGNLNNWWTENDYSKFKTKTEDMILQFDNLPLGEGKVNGKLVVSENIADLGGMASSLQTMENEKVTDYKSFFINYAKIWAQKSRPEYQLLLLSIDVHAPTYWRTNMIPRNFDQWYLAFNVNENDKMYLPNDKRIKIW